VIFANFFITGLLHLPELWSDFRLWRLNRT
jgi:hypothetical protein